MTASSLFLLLLPNHEPPLLLNYMKQALAEQYGVVEGSAAAVALEKAHQEEEFDDEGNPKKKSKEVIMTD